MDQPQPRRYARIGNYYSNPFVEIRDGKPVIVVDSWDHQYVTEISQEFYDAWLKEFPLQIDPPVVTP